MIDQNGNETYTYDEGTAYLCDEHYIYGDNLMPWGLLWRLTRTCYTCNLVHNHD